MTGDEWNSERERQQRALDRETGYEAPDERQAGLLDRALAALAPLIESARAAGEPHLGRAEHAKRIDRLSHNALRYRAELAALALAQSPAPRCDFDCDACRSHTIP